MHSDPEELLRSIERTREELANTVDTIAGRLDPKRVAKRGVGAVRDRVTNVVEGAKVKLHLADGTPTGAGHAASAPGEQTAATIAAASERAKAIAARPKRAPKPAAGGLAALVALAAIVAVRRRRR